MTRLLKAAGSMSAFTLLSRIFGLWRDRVMLQTLGAGWVQGTFLLAWVFPNLMRRLLGEGALSASFIPAYARLRRAGDRAQARNLLADVIGASATLLLPLCALIAVGGLLVPASWLPAGKVGGVAETRLLLVLNAILFPYALPVCLTAVYAGAMNTLGRFALPAAVPIVLNLFWIAGLYCARLFGITVDTEVATFTAWFLAVGGVAQLLLVVAPLWRQGELARPRLGWPAAGTPARMVFVAMGPTVLGMSLNQVGSLLDQLMAYYLIAPGANAYVYAANRLLLFPHALTALSVASAVFPKLAHEAVGDRSQLRATLDLSAAATIMVTLPASFGMIVLGDDVVTLLFEGRRFTAEDSHVTTLTTQCLLGGLPFLGLAQLYARAFYAVGDNRTPARLAMWLVLFNALLNLGLVFGAGFGTPALTLSSSTASLLNSWLLARRFHRHAGPGHTLHGAWLRSLAATAVMCVAIWLVQPHGAAADKFALGVWHVTVPILVGITVYVAAHLALRSPELRALRRRR